MITLPHLTLTLSPPAGSGEGTAIVNLFIVGKASSESRINWGMLLLA